jgi:hypothetical protein
VDALQQQRCPCSMLLRSTHGYMATMEDNSACCCYGQSSSRNKVATWLLHPPMRAVQPPTWSGSILWTWPQRWPQLLQG